MDTLTRLLHSNRAPVELMGVYAAPGRAARPQRTLHLRQREEVGALPQPTRAGG